MKKFKEELLSEIEDFREKGNKFLNGELSKMEFKGMSGGMGVYAERNQKTFIIRLRIPSGVTNLKEMNLIADMAERYGVDGIHLTTRQAIQFHELTIDQICDVMKEGIENHLYTRGAGGNFPRNVAMSPLAGVDPLEAFDVTPYALAVNNHFLKKITKYHLPRKLKVSFSSSNMDCGHCNITDLGFLAVMEDGKKYFKVYLGGGLGQNPRTAVSYGELIEPSDVLYHVEAMTRLFIAEGDYENKHKARIRYILDRMGEEEFINCYKKHLAEVIAEEDLKLHLSEHVINKEGIEIDDDNPRLFKQKQPGLYSVYIHPIGGQLSLKDLKRILYVLDAVEELEIRLTMTEGMYIRNLTGKEARILLEITDDIGGKTHLEESVACIGVPTCQMGLLESQKMLNMIIDYFRERGYDKDVLPRIHISGCGNSCGIHQACMIGLTGRKKKIDGVLEDVFEFHINGSFEDGNARLGKVYGTIPVNDIPEFLYELALLVERKNINFQDYLDQYEDEFNSLIEKYLK